MLPMFLPPFAPMGPFHVHLTGRACAYAVLHHLQNLPALMSRPADQQSLLVFCLQGGSCCAGQPGRTIQGSGAIQASSSSSPGRQGGAGRLGGCGSSQTRRSSQDFCSCGRRRYVWGGGQAAGFSEGGRCKPAQGAYISICRAGLQCRNVLNPCGGQASAWLGYVMLGVGKSGFVKAANAGVWGRGGHRVGRGEGWTYSSDSPALRRSSVNWLAGRSLYPFALTGTELEC
jgi:hypothetical protein